MGVVKIGLFNLFKKQKVIPVQKNADFQISEYKDGEYFISIESRGFFAKAISSPNGEYLIAAHKNNLVLVNRRKNEIVYDLTFDGVLSSFDLLVTNDLYFIVIDISGYQRLVNELYCYGSNGEPLIKAKVNANIQSIGLSDNRKYVCCQNANNPNHPDGGSLLILDMQTNKILHRWVPETGWADSYSFDNEKKNITLHYNNKTEYRYTFSGELVNKEQWEQKRLETLNGYRLIEIAENQIKSFEATPNKTFKLNDYKPVIDLLNAAVDKDISSYQRAQAYKCLGEIHYQFQENGEALTYFKYAVECNPKVGVKRILSKLEKVTG